MSEKPCLLFSPPSSLISTIASQETERFHFSAISSRALVNNAKSQRLLACLSLLMLLSKGSSVTTSDSAVSQNTGGLGKGSRGKSSLSVYFFFFVNCGVFPPLQNRSVWAAAVLGETSQSVESLFYPNDIIRYSEVFISTALVWNWFKLMRQKRNPSDVPI